jgi:hypothetical protein
MKVRISLRYNLPPSTIGKLPFREVLWMFAAIAYEQEMIQQKTEDQNGNV